MKPIVYIPNQVLTSEAKTVTRFDKRLIALIADMKQTLKKAHNPKGVGLAAPQVGEPWRIFLTRPKESDNIRVFINPEIINIEKQITHEDNRLEGCLSIPGIWGQVHRHSSLTIRYQDETGKIFTETCNGFLAVIIQHETDHVNGVLFTQRVLEQKGKLYQSAIDAKGKEILEQITLA